MPGFRYALRGDSELRGWSVQIPHRCSCRRQPTPCWTPTHNKRPSVARSTQRCLTGEGLKGSSRAAAPQLNGPRWSSCRTCSALPAAADSSLQATGHYDRVLGALVGAMAGNALGIQVEPEKHYRLTKLFPHGLQRFWGFDFNVSKTRVPPGATSGEFVTMLAVAHSLVCQQRLDFFHLLYTMADAYVQYPQDVRRYSPYSCMVLESLCQGVDPFTLAPKAEAMLDISTTRTGQAASNREERQRYGAGDASAVLRAVPIALAYAAAPQAALIEAVESAVMFSHPQESGRDGAVLLAAAVAWLARADPATPACNPSALLDHLQQLPLSPPTHALLTTLAQALASRPYLGRVSSWRQFWASKEWAQLVAGYMQLSRQNFTVQGSQAAAVALWALVVSWEEPEQAVMLAASFGGNSGTTAAATGALAGALHGASWIPSRWWEELENAPPAPAASAEEISEGSEADGTAAARFGARGAGRDAVVALAKELAVMECREVAPLYEPAAAAVACDD